MMVKRENNLDWAVALGLQALAHIISEPGLYEEFFELTGFSPAELRPPRIEQRDFLSSVLDFILLTDTRLLDFCAVAGINPSEPLRARRLLAGDSGQF